MRTVIWGEKPHCVVGDKTHGENVNQNLFSNFKQYVASQADIEITQKF